MDNSLTFFRGNRDDLLALVRAATRTGRFPMTFVDKLSVMTAYLALAFVGAIVLGVL
jgi:hypothetical protein